MLNQTTSSEVMAKPLTISDIERLSKALETSGAESNIKRILIHGGEIHKFCRAAGIGEVADIFHIPPAQALNQILGISVEESFLIPVDHYGVEYKNGNTEVHSYFIHSNIF